MTGFAALPVTEQEEQHQQFKGISKVSGPTWARLPAITIGLLGVQIFWSVEMSYASPYLLSLGLSKSSMAVVFVAGPLSGLIMQPLIGVLADNCTSRFGRRRPYMMLGTAICMSAMLLLGFTRPVASVFTAWGSDANDSLTIGLAVLSIYLIDFSINAVQAVDRALLVDTLPPSDQAAGNAWAARMLAVGSVVGFFIGNVNLPLLLPFLGSTQLEVLSVVVSLLLLSGHSIMAALVKEKVLLKTYSAAGKSQGKSFSQEIKDIWTNMRTLPRVIRQICIIQFFAWIAWFPVLFYSTLYVGDLYKRTANPATTDAEKASLDAEATRLGSRALFYSSILSLFVNLTLPAFVPEAAGSSKPGTPKQMPSFLERICRVPRVLQIHLSTLWAVSHLVFAGCMFATFFTHSVWGSTFIISITGFSWAVTQWAPFSLLAEAILTEPATLTTDDTGSIHLADTRTQQRISGDPQENAVFLANDGSDEEDEEAEALREERSRVLSNSGAQLSRIDIRSEGSDEDGYEIVPGADGGVVGGSGRSANTLSAKAGIILGIHNIFIVIPQFLVTGFSAILFALFDPKKPALPAHRGPVAPGPVINGTIAAAANITSAVVSRSGVMLQDLPQLLRRAEDEVEGSEHSNSVVYIFRIGGVAASFAFVLCWRLSRELRHR
ncbi:MFS general substrate transporter [Pholiota conissans]|uniref:MFS general substrate transporter n=1 Tax=Pholiota conissans TaxID=109636 RepID=A0A9P5YTI4_9AGAR|nr:MFS general substrate transporter [Pholiota conissans]